MYTVFIYVCVWFLYVSIYSFLDGGIYSLSVPTPEPLLPHHFTFYSPYICLFPAEPAFKPLCGYYITNDSFQRTRERAGEEEGENYLIE